MKVTQAVADYLQAREDEGMSPSTVSQERTTLSHLADWSRWRKLSTFTVSDLNEFLRYRAEKAMETGKVRNGAVTIGTRELWRVHIRNFFAYAYANDWVSKDPTRRWKSRAVTLPTREHMERKAFSKDQAKQLLDSAREPRDKAFLALGLYAGLRRSELEGLKWEHVDPAERAIRIPVELAKRAKARTVPMLPVVYDALKEWAGVVDPQPGWFVLCHRTLDHEKFMTRARYAWSNPTYDPTLPQKRLDRILAFYVHDVGLDPKDYSLHSMRHTFLTLLRDASWPIWEIQQVAGHASLAVTEKYFHTDHRQIAERAARTVL